jgi:CheY-like chemotaxis protein
MSTQNKIFVVDDDPVNRDFFQLMLSKLGFVVEEAGDGVDALEKLTKFRPDLILLDNIMPRMSGFELTRSLKDDPQYRDIPIIMFSALDDVQDKLTGFELGVDDYITKPFNFSEVLARIKTSLRNRELISQIVMRESRLNLAEVLNHDMKQGLADFIKYIDDLDSAAAALSSGEPLDQAAPAKLSGAIRDEVGKLRKGIAELDARLEKTILEWDALKKDEIGLPTLESQIRKFLSQE